jgi:hypothetical protein
VDILKNILVVLNDDPNGELPVSEVKAQVLARVADPQRLAQKLRDARDVTDRPRPPCSFGNHRGSRSSVD